MRTRASKLTRRSPSFRLDTGEPMPVPARSASPKVTHRPRRPILGAACWPGRRAHPRVVAAEASLAAKADPRWLIGGAGYLVALALATVGLHAAATHEKTSEGAGAVVAGRARSLARRRLWSAARCRSAVAFSLTSYAKFRSSCAPSRATAFGLGAASEANRAEGFIFDTSSLTAEPGIEVQSPKPVRRIASLGPSADELLVSAETDERRAWPLASFTPSLDGEARVDAVRTVKTAAGPPWSSAVRGNPGGAGRSGRSLPSSDRQLEGAARRLPGEHPAQRGSTSGLQRTRYRDCFAGSRHL